MVKLTTPRLLLRRWRAEDVAVMARFNADPEVMRWTGDGSALDVHRTAAEIAGFEGLWKATGYGRFAVELRETGALIGFAGMAIPVDVPAVMPAVEIGWRLGRAYWGRGLATEAAREALRFGFNEGALRHMLSIHVTGHDVSARIMVKLGMRHVLDTVDAVHGRPMRVYATSTADEESHG